MKESETNFNEAICSSIDETITEVLGSMVLNTIYDVLRTKYDVTRDELPYRNPIPNPRKNIRGSGRENHWNSHRKEILH